MATKVIDAQLLQKAFIAGAYNLERNKDYINELNVFPVPDGDTGSNMSLTIMAAAREVSALENPSMDELSKTISSGSLRGARGNSGVILSQLLRGFCKEIKGKKQITVSVLSDGFVRAVETAYKAQAEGRYDPDCCKGRCGKGSGAFRDGYGFRDTRTGNPGSW